MSSMTRVPYFCRFTPKLVTPASIMGVMLKKMPEEVVNKLFGVGLGSWYVGIYFLP